MPSPTSRRCPACGRDVVRFEPGPRDRPDARCPHCQSLERHRFLAILLDTLEPLLVSARVVLDIAPQAQIRRTLRAKLGAERIVGLDIEGVRDVDVLGDVRALPLGESSVDLALCYHVFEHVREDRQAMREVVRVLSPSGVAIVSNPRRRGRPTDEDPDAPVEDRIRRFGQADHLRAYGDDFEDRLREEGLAVDRLTPDSLLSAQEVEHYGLNGAEEVWICRRLDGALGADPLDDVRRDEPSDLVELSLQQLTEAVARSRHEAHRARREAAIARRDADEARALAENWRSRYETIAEHPLVRPVRMARRAAMRVRARFGSDDT